MKLKSSHSSMYQVMGQMAVLGVQWAGQNGLLMLRELPSVRFLATKHAVQTVCFIEQIILQSSFPTGLRGVCLSSRRY